MKKQIFKMLGYLLLYISVYFIIFKSTLFVCENIMASNSLFGIWLKENQLGSIILNDVFALPIFALLVFLFKKESVFKVTHIRKIGIREIATSIVIGLFMGVFLLNFFNLPFALEIPIFNEILEFIYNSGIIAFAGFVLIGTFFKEILFRGLIFNELNKVLPLIMAIFVHALIYGALFFNFNIPLTLFAILGNIVVVLAYYLTGSIWAAYIAQAFNNICVYTIRSLKADLFFGKEIPLLILSVGVLLGALIYLNWLRKSKNEKILTEEKVNEAC